MKKVLVIGSSNVDYMIRCKAFPKRGETVVGNSFMQNLGGKGLNQAVAASLTGADVTFLTALGNDSGKDFILNGLKPYNLKVVPIKKRTSTGSAMILVEDKTSENEIVINGGANLLLNNKNIDSNINLIKECDYILLQLEIDINTIEYIIKKAKEFNKIVILNTAPYKKLNDYIITNADYLTPNQVELKALAGNQFDNLEDNIDYLLNKGVKNLIITLGKEGSLFVNKNTRLIIPAYKVKAIDSTGAGDCYNGFFVGALAIGYDLKNALDIASKASALSVTKEGTITSYPTMEEI